MKPTPVRAYKCPVCGRILSSAEAVEGHMRTDCPGNMGRGIKPTKFVGHRSDDRKVWI